MHLVLPDMMESLAKIEAACNRLPLTISRVAGALVMTEAYCNSLSQEIPAVTVAGKLSELLPFNHNLFSEDR